LQDPQLNAERGKNGKPWKKKGIIIPPPIPLKIYLLAAGFL
jgi:hypothetical protein